MMWLSTLRCFQNILYNTVILVLLEMNSLNTKLIISSVVPGDALAPNAQELC